MRTRSPHNALFISVFSKKEQAVAALRAIVPATLAALIDWDCFALANGSFIDAELSHRETDLLYWAKLLTGEEIAIYLLWEHQSTFDPLMPLRVLRYKIRIVDQWLASHKGARRIPVIIPVVVSHVAGGWKASESYMDILMLPGELHDVVRDYVPNFRFIHDDLTKASDTELTSRSMQALGSLALLLLKHSRENKSMVPLLKQWIELLREVWKAANREEAFSILIRYILLANRKTNVHELRSELVPLLGDAADEVIMTDFQRMMAQVRAEERRMMAQERAEAERMLAQQRAEAERMVAQQRAEAERMLAQERAAREQAEKDAREARAQVEKEAREARGLAEREARASAVLAILRARGLEVSEKQRAQIQSCSDLTTLAQWLERAVTAQSVEEAVGGV